MLNTGLRLTRDGFTAHQALSSRQLTFSLTEACPLRCSHCIVDTVPAADRSRALSLENAEFLAADLPGLIPRGVRFVSFTGGEPLLAFRQLQMLSHAAVLAGMDSTVVTACHWAKTENSAARVVAALPNIPNWHLSTDVFHEEYLPVSYVITAAHAVAARGGKCLVRICAPLPLSGRSAQLYDEVRSSVPPSVPAFVQPVTGNGRAKDLNTDLLHYTNTRAVPAFPCVPNGMVVRYDCSVAPCCAGLVHQRSGHPFQFGQANEIGLAAVHEQWCTDGLLQLIRVVGFAPLLQWLPESFPRHPLSIAAPEHPCECCLQLWQDPAVGAEMRRRAEAPAMARKIAEMAQSLFDEPFLSERMARAAL